MIPKVIHYCNFGNMQLTPLLQECRESWRRFCRDYELVEWNEKTFTPYTTPFVERALNSKRFAFASDYVRAFVLCEFGGVYLDADVELRASLDPFLAHQAFTGFEVIGYPFTAVWGSEKGHSLARRVVEVYRGIEYTDEPNTAIVSRIITEHYGIDASRDTFQIGKEGLAIYPSTTFCVDTDISVAVHHFAGSWLDRRLAGKYKRTAAAAYHAAELARLNALTEPVVFKHIQESVGLPSYVGWLCRMAVRDYARRAVRRIRKRKQR